MAGSQKQQTCCEDGKPYYPQHDSEQSNNQEENMGRFRITRNDSKEQKQLLQAKLDSSVIADINLLCQWSGNEKNYVIAELLRYALSQEAEFQKHKQSSRSTDA